MWSVPNKTARLCLVCAVSLLCFLCINIGRVRENTGDSGDTALVPVELVMPVPSSRVATSPSP